MMTSTPSATKATFLKLSSKPAEPSMISPVGPLALAMAKVVLKVTDLTTVGIALSTTVEGEEKMAQLLAGRATARKVSAALAASKLTPPPLHNQIPIKATELFGTGLLKPPVADSIIKTPALINPSMTAQKKAPPRQQISL